jgi:hypothetical protein
VQKPLKNDASVLLRLPSELKTRLLREAAMNGRRITAEINLRLSASLGADRGLAPAAPVEQDLLAAVRDLPARKQLALLMLLGGQDGAQEPSR